MGSATAHLLQSTATIMASPKLKIYGIPPSAPCRVVYLTCHVLGLDYEVIPMDPRIGQTKEPEFLKLNPHHTIPLLIDGDFKLDESRPCALYLVEKYGKDSKLLPEDVEARARVFHDLFFDMGSYYSAVLGCAVPVIFMGAQEPAPDKLEKLKEVLGFMNEKVKKTGFASGTDHLTLADLAYLATTSTLVATGIIADLPPELDQWYNKCKSLIPDYEKANGLGAEEFGQGFKNKGFFK